MSVTLDPIDLSTAVVGSIATPINWINKIVLLPVGGVNQKEKAHVRLFNESGVQLRIQFNGGRSDRIPAGAWPVYELEDSDTGLLYIVEAVLPNSPISLLSITLYAPGEKVPDTPILGNSPIGLSGGVVGALVTKIPINTTGGNIVGIEFGPDANSLSDWEFICSQNGDFFLFDNKNLRKIWTAILANGIISVPFGLTLDNSTNDTPNVLFNDTVNNSHAYWDMNSEVIRIVGGYRGAGEVQRWSMRLVDSQILQIGNLVLDNGTSDTPNLVVNDAPHNTRAYVDMLGESMRIVASYRGAAEREIAHFNAQTGALAVLGDIDSVGGQATAGIFGVPLIVASKFEQNITATGLTTIISQVLVAGLYRISGAFALNNSVNGQLITFRYTFTGRTGAITDYLQIRTSSIAFTNLQGGVSVSNTDWEIWPLTFPAAAGTLTISYNDPGGVPNDFVSVVVERLA